MTDRIKCPHTWCTGTHTLGVVALFQQTMYTTNWKLETGLGGAGLRLALSTGLTTRLSSFAYESARLGVARKVISQSAHPFQTKR